MNLTIKTSKKTAQCFVILCLTTLICGDIYAQSNNSAPVSAPERWAASKEIFSTPASVDAACAYFTTDHQSNPVLCWTQEEPSAAKPKQSSQAKREQGTGMLYYAVFERTSGLWSAPIAVTSIRNTGFHPESMNKVAFKADGTVIAVCEVKKPTSANPYAGEIHYTQSTDGGKTWSSAKPLHRSVQPGTGHAFFDITRLPDGEIGASWLDVSHDRAKGGGRPVHFAKTEQGRGFVYELCVDNLACECCRTEIYADPTGLVHIAYRDIIPTEGGTIRDMAHVVSTDAGKTFTVPTRIAADNWLVNGCPHTGPSLAANKTGLAAVWFTGATKAVHFAKSDPNANGFQAASPVDDNARHPQLIAVADDALALVYETTIADSAVVALQWGKSLGSVQQSASVGINNKALVARKALFPVSAMARTVRAMSAATLNARLEASSEKDELAELAETFNRLLERLEQSFSAQKRFVADVAHELRTPLITLLTELEIAVEKERALPEYRKAIEQAIVDVRRLARLINGLLDLAKADYDEAAISFKPLRVDELVVEARSLVTAQNDYTVHLHLEREIECDDALTARGNEYLLKAAFVNLMENGCKFSSNNTVSVTIIYNETTIIIRFNDNGIGIDEEDLPHIFRPFHRGANKRYAEGHGIGLSLTQKIIRLHGGSVGVVSERGAGSTFTVELPRMREA